MQSVYVQTLKVGQRVKFQGVGLMVRGVVVDKRSNSVAIVVRPHTRGTMKDLRTLKFAINEKIDKI